MLPHCVAVSVAALLGSDSYCQHHNFLPSPHVAVTIAPSLPVYCFFRSHGAVVVAVSASADAGSQMFLLTVTMPTL